MINALVFEVKNVHPFFGESLDKNGSNIFNCLEIKNSTYFKDDVLKALSSDFEFTALFMNNNILFKKIDEEIINQALSDEDVFCFSLRLGENTKYCASLDLSNTLHDQEERGEVIVWNWSKHYLDYGFPLSLNGHIFRTKELLKLIKKVPFTNATSLEEGLQIFEFLPREKMASYKHNVLIGANIPNHESTTFETLDFSNINSVQQIINSI